MKRRKPKAERKEELIRVRVTADQKAALTKRAAKYGLDVSVWLRSLGLQEIEKSES
jgi:Mobilization protein NikA